MKNVTNIILSAVVAKATFRTAPVRGLVATHTVATPDGWGVKYHDTIVAWFPRWGGVNLHSGGFYSATTARRMNQAMAANGLTMRVSRSKGEYVLTHRHPNGVTQYKFDAGIRI